MPCGLMPHGEAHLHVARAGAPVGRRGKPVPPPRSWRPAQGRDTTSAARSSCAALTCAAVTFRNRFTSCRISRRRQSRLSTDMRARVADRRRAAWRTRMPGPRQPKAEIGRSDSPRVFLQRVRVAMSQIGRFVPCAGCRCESAVRRADSVGVRARTDFRAAASAADRRHAAGPSTIMHVNARSRAVHQLG
jgi:hypothetical protein